MHIHILGIGGTFMSGLAILARQAGHTVTGSDINCYAPICDLLQQERIQWVEGYHVCDEVKNADFIIVGNAMKRGMPVIEYIMNENKPYTSGPQWLFEHILSRYQVIAVSGTHGKTTTTCMITHILEEAGLNPSFLIGGVSPKFGTNARLTNSPWFVIEADEYDSAFFDKRPKLMHYRPRVAIINNLEFDHADIYPNLEAIQQQFHYFLRTIPAQGSIIYPANHATIDTVLKKGVYSQQENFSLDDNATWHAKILDQAGQNFEIYHRQQYIATIQWPVLGFFNVENALAAVAATAHTGINLQEAASSLSHFSAVKRRLEIKAVVQDITIYDDFAHHPTAIEKTLEAIKKSQRHQRVLIVLEFASYTMRTGVHRDRMSAALKTADDIYILKPHDFSLEEVSNWQKTPHIIEKTEEIVEKISEKAQSGDAILIMSNRGFEQIHEKIIEALKQRSPL